MRNKLVERYQQIEEEFSTVQDLIANRADVAVIQEQIADLETKQTDLKKTVMHLTALSKLREEALLALSH